MLFKCVLVPLLMLGISEWCRTLRRDVLELGSLPFLAILEVSLHCSQRHWRQLERLPEIVSACSQQVKLSLARRAVGPVYWLAQGLGMGACRKVLQNKSWRILPKKIGRADGRGRLRRRLRHSARRIVRRTVPRFCAAVANSNYFWLVSRHSPCVQTRSVAAIVGG